MQTASPLLGVTANPTVPFITLVNAGLTGVFAALVAVAFDAPGPLVGAVG